jgi:hypothetical protein
MPDRLPITEADLRQACATHAIGRLAIPSARRSTPGSLEPVPFATAHGTGSSLLFFEHLYPPKRFRLNR